MDFQGALGLLRRVKALGFRMEEAEVPIPENVPRPAGIPAPESYFAPEDSNADSFHQSMLLSDFAYTPRGSFAFSALASEISETLKAGQEKGEDAGAARFGKTKNSAQWRDAIGSGAGEKEAAGAFSALPRKGGPEGDAQAQFVANCNGGEVRCFMRLGPGWKRIFSMPFGEGVWPVPGNRFVVAYSSGKGIYGEG
jgi:hypothetical protein